MKMLFFASDECKKCKAVLEAIRRSGVSKLVKFEYVDAFDDENDDICDLHGVDDLPHIKVFNGNSLIFESVGQCDLRKLIKACGATPKTEKYNLSKKPKKA